RPGAREGEGRARQGAGLPDAARAARGDLAPGAREPASRGDRRRRRGGAARLAAAAAMIRKLLFMPVKALSGLLAGALAAKAFEGAWRLIDRERPPDPAQRCVRWSKLVLALALQGAIFRGV